MSIVVNGTNLKSASFNGQNVDSIYYNGSLVWERPPELQLISGIQSDGKAWIKTDFGTEDFIYSNTSQYGIYSDIQVAYNFHFINDYQAATDSLTIYTNRGETADTTKDVYGLIKLTSDEYPVKINGRAGKSGTGITRIPFYKDYRYHVYTIGHNQSRLQVSYACYDLNNTRVNDYGSYDSTNANLSVSSNKYRILPGTSNLKSGIVLRDITFGGEEAKKKELQRILKPAIMKRKGVETVGLYDAKRGIFYGPQEGSFIPHY